MKNTTTTLLEDVARWLKGKAAEAGRSTAVGLLGSSYTTAPVFADTNGPGPLTGGHS